MLITIINIYKNYIYYVVTTRIWSKQNHVLLGDYVQEHFIHLSVSIIIIINLIVGLQQWLINI